MDTWLDHARRAQAMGFEWLHLHPIQQPGFSGSIYSIKDFFGLNPMLTHARSEISPMDQLRDVVKSIQHLGLKVALELVVTHVARDSTLVRDHPNWFRRDRSGQLVNPKMIDPDDRKRSHVLTDIVEVDNAHSTDRQGLWAYWTAMVQYYLDLGFDGLFFDAAHRAPTALWQHLFRAGRSRNKQVKFFGDALGGHLAEVRSLAGASFDYLLNSSMWWNFDDSWCVEQQNELIQLAGSVSFPEHQSSGRRMLESEKSVAVQKQRYAFAAAFSEALMMPMGYEFCATVPLDAVRSTPSDWLELVQGTQAKKDAARDLQMFVGRVNKLAASESLVASDGQWFACSAYDSPSLLLRKRVSEKDMWMAINKDWHGCHPCALPSFDRSVDAVRICGDVPDRSPVASVLELGPAEVVYLL